MSKLSCFDDDWINPDHHPSWTRLRKVEDKNKAMCIKHRKTFSLSNMGSQAVKSHEKSAKHVRITTASTNQPTVMTYFSNEENQTSTELLPVSTEKLFVSLSASVTTASSSNAGSVTPFSQFAVPNDVTKSEILWTLHICYRHLSYRFCSELGLLFQNMFPDSQIAKKLITGKTKMAYNITHGLSPYFHDQVEQLVSNVKCIVVCFDESLNEVAQKEQMDICVR